MRLRRMVGAYGARPVGPVPQRLLLNSVSAGAQAAFLSAGAGDGRQGGEGGVARGGRPRATLQSGRDWYRIENSQGGPTVVDIFDEIGYWGVTAADFQRELAAVTAPEITVNLNSPGGEIFEGIAIYNALRSHPANVTIRVAGLAASIASVIAQAGDRVVMQPHSQMMIHDGSGLAIGNAADMREMADLLDRQSNNIAAVYAERAGGTVEEWRERMLAETWYSADEAVEAGLADEVDAPARQGQEPAPAAQPAAKWDLTVFKHAGREQAPAPQPVASTAPLATGGTITGTDAVGEGPVCDGAAPPAATPAAPTLVELDGQDVTDLVQAQPQPDANEQPAEPEPVDPWASLTAHLTEQPADPWAAMTARLIPAASPAATDA